MITTIQRIAFPDHRRILMISDLHGHADGLRHVLRQARFGPDDILVIVGDLVEKGPQSLETLRLVMALEKECTVYPLMGNVDLWRLEFLQSDDPRKWEEMKDYSLRAKTWWGNSMLGEMCAEIGMPLTAETDMATVFPEIQRHFAPEIAFLSGLITILDTQRITFVHGGIPHERLDELAGTDAYPLLKFDDFYSAGFSFRKYVAVGHWPAVLYSPTYPDFRPLIDRQRRIISMDGACGVKSEGQLNLLILPDWRSDDFSLITWDGLPVIQALDDQTGSPAENARYIRWNDHAISVQRRGGHQSLILHHGMPMNVPTSCIFDHDGVLSCSDITDYRLPVSAGDTLHLILRLPNGCYVKKNGIAGWYMGRYTRITEEEPS